MAKVGTSDRSKEMAKVGTSYNFSEVDFDWFKNFSWKQSFYWFLDSAHFSPSTMRSLTKCIQLCLTDHSRFSQTSGGSRISQKGAPALKVEVPTYYLAIFFPKTAWKWKKLDRGGRARVPGVPLKSANAQTHRIGKNGSIGITGFIQQKMLL